ncbi:acetamidase/formamidase family protein [Paenibacillus polymyxa]|uniref:acetamidase/formamidase family protein n=1 Tax=Paenibacillus polymyxa TaxID=1406 RepID=UPI002036260D|nr:acetamidase/formamidase family protein [Paenibacillus polymyxa]
MTKEIEHLLQTFEEWALFVKTMNHLEEKTWNSSMEEGKWTIKSLVSHVMLWDRYFYKEVIEKIALKQPVTLKHINFEEFNRKAIEYVNRIVPGSYGFTSAGGYPNWQNQKLHLTEVEELSLNWRLDRQTMNGTCEIKGKSFTVSLSPFMGVVGMPPESGGIHTTWPPRYCGGNIDCKELVQGSKLYLPIPVDGGYLAIGDGHARQGDGEVSCQAIECPMKVVDVTLSVIDDMILTNPHAHTPSGWITFGFHEDLNEATVQALDGMLNLMGELYGLDRVEAIALGSAVIDLRITQIVNGVKGVHAVLPYDVFK